MSDGIILEAGNATPTASVPYVGNLDFADRNQVAKDMATMAGIRLPKTWVPEGESLLPIGETAKRRLETEIANLPSLGEGLAALRSQIRSEDHRDVVVPVQRVRMDPTVGGLFGQGQDPAKAIGYTPRGFDQICSFIKPRSVKQGFKSTLLALPPSLRSDAFNYFAETSTRPEGVDAVLRTLRDPRGRRIVKAVASQRHSLESGDDMAIADAIESALPAGAKLRITRSLDRTDLEIIWPAMNREIVVGDVVKISLRITNSETKGSSLMVMPQLLRAICYNFTVAYSEGGEEEIAIRHIGDLRTKLPAAIARALAIVDPFVQAFGDAYKVALPEFAPTRGEILTRARAAFMLPSGATELAAQMWDADGDKTAGDTLAGLVNALTRASQNESMESAAKIESAAGKIIMQGWGALE